MQLNRALGTIAELKQQLDLKTRHIDQLGMEARDVIHKLQAQLDSKGRELGEAMKALERQQAYIKARGGKGQRCTVLPWLPPICDVGPGLDPETSAAGHS